MGTGVARPRVKGKAGGTVLVTRVVAIASSLAMSVAMSVSMSVAMSVAMLVACLFMISRAEEAKSEVAVELLTDGRDAKWRLIRASADSSSFKSTGPGGKARRSLEAEAPRTRRPSAKRTVKRAKTMSSGSLLLLLLLLLSGVMMLDVMITKKSDACGSYCEKKKC